MVFLEVGSGGVEGVFSNNGLGVLVVVVGGVIVEYKGGEGVIKLLDDEDLEVKLCWISE